MKAFMKSPTKIVGELTANSLGRYAEDIPLIMATRKLPGALLKSAGGSAAAAKASLGIEQGATMVDVLKESGVDMSDPDSLRAGLADE